MVRAGAKRKRAPAEKPTPKAKKPKAEAKPKKVGLPTHLVVHPPQTFACEANNCLWQEQVKNSAITLGDGTIDSDDDGQPNEYDYNDGFLVPDDSSQLDRESRRHNRHEFDDDAETLREAKVASALYAFKLRRCCSHSCIFPLPLLLSNSCKAMAVPSYSSLPRKTLLE